MIRLEDWRYGVRFASPMIMARTTAFDYAVPYIDGIMEKANSNRIVDLCSGASGPWLRLVDKLRDANAQIILTDKYPNTTTLLWY